MRGQRGKSSDCSCSRAWVIVAMVRGRTRGIGWRPWRTGSKKASPRITLSLDTSRMAVATTKGRSVLIRKKRSIRDPLAAKTIRRIGSNRTLLAVDHQAHISGNKHRHRLRTPWFDIHDLMVIVD